MAPPKLMRGWGEKATKRATGTLKELQEFLAGVGLACDHLPYSAHV